MASILTKAFKLNFGLIAIVMLIAMLSSFAGAVNIGVTPGQIHFKDMLRGGYAQRTAMISTSIDQPLLAHLTVYGEVKDWIEIDSDNGTFSLSRDDPYRMKVMVNPPDDIQNGNYSGFIRVVTDKLGDLEGGGTGSVVKAAVSIQLKVEIGDEQKLACRGGGLSIGSIEVGYPVEVAYTIINDGNVRMKPHVEVDIWDQERNTLLHSAEFFDESVKQTEEQRITKSIFVDLPIGQYWADVKIGECDVSQTLTFSVLEKGSIEDYGQLISINTNPWVRVGDIVPITAVFRNDGKRNVFAAFEGKVSYNNQIVHIIDSDELLVPVNSEMNFTSYYTSKYPGSFVVTGRVRYNKKLTYEKGTVINIMPEDWQPSGGKNQGLRLIPILIYLVMLTIIIFLLTMIRKRHKFNSYK